jgi:nucleoside-diphosphate-sugar epimerase
MITENTLLAEDQKRSTYEVSKFGAEMEVWRASQEGLNVVIVNPGIVLGDGFYDSGSGLLLHKMRKGLRFYPPKTTGFISVYDVSKATYELMKSNIVNERFVLVSENLSFKTVISQFSKLYQQPQPKQKLKPWMLYIAWFLGVLKSFFSTSKRQLTLDTIPSLFENSFYSSSKIKSEINFEFESLESYAPKIVERSKKLV